MTQNQLSPSELILWGAAGHALVLRECMRESSLNLTAIFDNDESMTSPFPDVPIWYGRGGFERWLSSRESNRPVGFLVAIGGARGRDRIDIQKNLESYGLIPLVAKHPSAFVADSASIGTGTQVLAHATVCVEVRTGRACIVNTGAAVDHECRIGDGVHIGPSACLTGCIQVGDYAMIGAAAVVLPRLTIGEGAIVGAGAVVTKDVPPLSIAVGNPARVVRKVRR